MNRNLIRAEWRRSRQALASANLLHESGLCDDAVSRAYYAVMHAAKAALLLQAIQPNSHAAVRRLFGLHLIRTGVIEPEWGTHLAETSDDRIVADYDVETCFSPDETGSDVDEATAFVYRIRQYLLDSGIDESDLDEQW